MDRFDRRDPELCFMELAKLRQSGTTNAYISEFERVAVMVTDVSEHKLVMLFIEGLSEPLRGWVKAFKLGSLQDIITMTRDMEHVVPRKTFPPKSFIP
jgi:hypothetical protein